MKILLLLFFSLSVKAAEIPKLQAPVNDYAKVLSEKVTNQINQDLIKFQEKHQVQVAILTIPSLKGEDIESFSIKIADSWALGSKSTDEGVLFLLVTEDKKVRIEVGQGLEGVLTDLQSKRILSSIKPSLKAKEYDAAITLALAQILNTIERDKIKESKPMVKTKSVDQAHPLFWGAILLILFLVFFLL